MSQWLKIKRKIFEKRKEIVQKPDLRMPNGRLITAGSALPRFQNNYIENGARHVLFTGKYNNMPVKIYEVHNEAHAQFIALTTSSCEQKGIFPNILWTQGRFVVAEWIAEENKKPVQTSQLVELLARVQDLKLIENSGDVFDYWRHFVSPRFLRAAELIGEEKNGIKIIDEIDQYWDEQSPFLSHPDVTASNFIFSKDKRVYIIDNEFLSIGRLRDLDFYNLRNAVPKSEWVEATNLWERKRGGHADKDEHRITEMAWKARVIGSLLQVGNLNKMISTFDKCIDIFKSKQK
ncbi:hypothetical protein OAI25_04645 [Alphaproteobacteria bacterium]|nr:hypothetical protein [Alphaproteobacteria bacterium]